MHLPNLKGIIRESKARRYSPDQVNVAKAKLELLSSSSSQVDFREEPARLFLHSG